MPVIGFGFDKINVEKKESLKEYKVKNNINVLTIEESKLQIGKDSKPAIRALFEFIVDYEKAGKVELKGFLMYFDTETKIKEILDGWKKEEKLPSDFGALLYNQVINKSTIKALELEESVGFPMHIVLPKVQPKK